MSEMNEPLRKVFCSACGSYVQLAPSISPNQPLVRYMVNDDGTAHSRTCKPIKLRMPKPKPTGPLLPMMKDHEEPEAKSKRGVRPGG